MKKLQKLNMSVSVTIPTRHNNNELMSQKVYESALDVTGIVGGVTVDETLGMWLEEGIFFEDSNERYMWAFSSDNKQFTTIKHAIMQLILDLIHHGDQYAVFISVNGVKYVFDRDMRIGDVGDVLDEVRDNA